MRKLALLCIAAFTSMAALAQHEINAGAELAFPTGASGESFSIGIGVTGKYAYNIDDAMAVTGTFGFMSFSGKNGGESVMYIPFKGGFRYSFNGAEGFYAEPQIGFGSFSKGVGTGFLFAINGGYRLPKIDLSLRYETVSLSGGSANFVGLRAGYTIMPK